MEKIAMKMLLLPAMTTEIKHIPIEEKNDRSRKMQTAPTEYGYKLKIAWQL